MTWRLSNSTRPGLSTASHLDDERNPEDGVLRVTIAPERTLRPSWKPLGSFWKPLGSSWKPRCVWTAAALVSLVQLPQARAEDTDVGTAQAEPEERPKMNLTVAPNEPAVQRSAYVHNGFYFRLGVGPGYLFNTIRNKSTSTTFDAHTFAFSTDLLVGGSPSPGMSLGAGVLADLVPTANYGFDKNTLFRFTVGPFFDAFPNDRDGFHLGALVGFSGLSVNETVGMPLGGGATGWLGYDFWVADEWSAGVQLQAGGSFHVNSDYSAAVFQTSLMISVLRN